MSETADYSKTAEPEAHAASHESGGSDIITHPYTPPSAYDLTNDPNCVALWRFENGALTVDSIGGNTLTNNNGVTANLVDFKEGSASADFLSASSKSFQINDSDLDDGFSFKGNDTNKEISVCSWFKAQSFPGIFNGLFSKYDIGNNKRSLQISVKNDGRFTVNIGISAGASAETIYSGGSLYTGMFYHYGFTYRHSDKSWQIVVWDDTAQFNVIYAFGSSTNTINIEDAAVSIGAAALRNGIPEQFWNGEIDRTVVLKDILTLDEMNSIRVGTS